MLAGHQAQLKIAEEHTELIRKVQVGLSLSPITYGRSWRHLLYIFYRFLQAQQDAEGIKYLQLVLENRKFQQEQVSDVPLALDHKAKYNN